MHLDLSIQGTSCFSCPDRLRPNICLCREGQEICMGSRKIIGEVTPALEVLSLVPSVEDVREVFPTLKCVVCLWQRLHILQSQWCTEWNVHPEKEIYGVHSTYIRQLHTRLVISGDKLCNQPLYYLLHVIGNGLKGSGAKMVYFTTCLPQFNGAPEVWVLAQKGWPWTMQVCESMCKCGGMCDRGWPLCIWCTYL